MGVGDITGKVKVYDIRYSKDLFSYSHHNSLGIKSIVFTD